MNTFLPFFHYVSLGTLFVAGEMSKLGDMAGLKLATFKVVLENFLTIPHREALVTLDYGPDIGE